MAYLSGLKSLGNKGSPALGAVTGFLGGLNQGMQDRQRQQAEQARLQLHQQESALRKKALEYGLDKDKQITGWSQKLGEYQAWRAGSEDEIQQQGPTQPGAPALPSQPDYEAISKRLQDLASSIPDARTRDAFLQVAQQEEQMRAVTQHKDRLLGSLQDRITKNAYSRRVYGGAEDPSASEAVLALIEQVQGVDMNDPQSAAKILDHIEEEDRKLRVATVQHNLQMQQREEAIADYEAQSMAREGAGVPQSEAKGLLAAYKADLIDDAQFQKAMPDALAGTLGYKMQAMQKDLQIQELQMELLRARAASERGDAFKNSPMGMMLGAAARSAGSRNGSVNLERTREAPSGPAAREAGTRLTNISKVNGILEEEFGPQEDVPEDQRAAYSARKDQLLELAGEQDAANKDDEALKKLLKSLGVNPEQKVKVK